MVLRPRFAVLYYAGLPGPQMLSERAEGYYWCFHYTVSIGPTVDGKLTPVLSCIFQIGLPCTPSA